MSGSYFALLTLAFNQLIFAVALKWRALTGGDDGIGLDKHDMVLPLIGTLDTMNTTTVYYVTVIIVAISIGQTDGSCEEALASAADLDVPPRRLVLVCDPYDRVRRLYGNARGRYFVLGNFLRIEAIGELSDVDALRRDVRRVVHMVFDQYEREGMYDSDAAGYE